MINSFFNGLFPRKAARYYVAVIGLLGVIPGALGSDLKQAEEAFNEVCSSCHSVEFIFEGPRLTSQQWDSTVRDMVGRGAEATDEQLDLIRTYLKKTWGTVWINRAVAEELSIMLGLPADVAEKVIAYREANGAFEDLESLKAVPGVDPTVLDTQAEAILFN